MTIPEKLQKHGRRALLATALASAAMSGSAVAETAKSTSRVEATAAKLTALLHKQRSLAGFPIDFKHKVVWNDKGPEAKTVKVTDVALSKKVDGHEQYFRIDQTGHSIGTLKVRAIPSQDVAFVLNSPLYPDQERAGVHETITSNGHLTLRHGEPFVGVTITTENDRTHQTRTVHTNTPVGVTTPQHLPFVG